MLNPSSLLLVVQLLSTIHQVLIRLKTASGMPKISNKQSRSPAELLTRG